MNSQTRNLFNVALTTPLAFIAAGCPLFGGGETGDDTTGAPEPIHGYMVECRPDLPGDQQVCMSPNDFNCPARGHYIREALCADIWEGPLSDYNGRPILVHQDVDCYHLPEPQNDDPATPEDETIRDMNSYNPNSECNDCQVCRTQVFGYTNDLLFPPTIPLNEDSWNEIEFCPDHDGVADYDEVEAFCEPGGEPTTEDEPTAGEDVPSTGDWICAGSTEISGLMLDTFILVSEDERFFGSSELPVCVKATDVSTAQSACHDLCTDKNAGHQKEDDESDYKTWTPFNCMPLSSAMHVETMNPEADCFGGGSMAFVDPHPLTATAQVRIGEGTASTDQLNGLVDFTVGPCAPGALVCDVSITSLHANTFDVHGAYMTRNPVGAISSDPFVVEDLSARLLQPVKGELDVRLGVVTFPREKLFVIVSSGTVSLDGTPMSAGLTNVSFAIDSARGTWNGQKLTLDLDWALGDVSLWLRLDAE